MGWGVGVLVVVKVVLVVMLYANYWVMNG